MSTESSVCVTQDEMAKDSKYPERVLLLLAEGWTARIDAARVRHESRTDVIREAIERELKRRDRLNTQTPEKNDGED